MFQVHESLRKVIFCRARVFLCQDICSFIWTSQSSSLIPEELREKDDGVAGCCTGLALSFPGIHELT
ncbi:hypothetical protein HHK36_005763 [Tetracentron sinense]|uniref:Uncharacterized protein n=1 Tax=Tetracentron sinense TaxID=13715 RepID=A0A835DQY3_TETSI|nr:hypothetical protein HHK36_005763 [Tetracentron sinense]